MVQLPWKVSDMAGKSFDFLRQHVFYPALSGKDANPEEFQANLEQLTNSDVKEILNAVPENWWPNENLQDEIESYLMEAVENSASLVQLVLKMTQP